MNEIKKQKISLVIDNDIDFFVIAMQYDIWKIEMDLKVKIKKAKKAKKPKIKKIEQGEQGENNN